MLAHFRGQDGLALGELVHHADDFLRLDHVGGGRPGDGLLLLPRADLFLPRREAFLPRERLAGGDVFADGDQRVAAVAHHGNAHVDVLVDGRGVDVDVNDGGLGRKRGEASGHAVVETNAHGDQEIGVADGLVGGVGAVHAEHAEPLRMIAGERAEAHQGTGHRDVQVVGEVAEFFAGVGHDHAAAAEQQGPFRLVQGVHDLAYLGVIGAVGRVVAAQADVFGPHELGGGLEHVLGQVYEHGTGTPGARQIERLPHDLGEVLYVLHHIVVFGAGAGDARDVHLLERVVADEAGGHLSGEDHQRDGVAVGRRDAGHGVGRAGAGGRHAHADLARGAGVAVGGVNGGLFVPHQNMS